MVAKAEELAFADAADISANAKRADHIKNVTGTALAGIRLTDQLVSGLIDYYKKKFNDLTIEEEDKRAVISSEESRKNKGWKAAETLSVQTKLHAEKQLIAARQVDQSMKVTEAPGAQRKLHFATK